MEEILKSYFAGCIDCDGSIGIKRSTYAMRVMNNATQPVFSERVLFSQVKPDITKLLVDNFGGNFIIQKPATPKSKPIYKWCVTDRKAIVCINTILPYLKIKRQQAEILLELRKLKEIPKIKHGTFIMKNHWGYEVTMPRRIVDPAVTLQKETLFNQIKNLNDTRNIQPQFIGNGNRGKGSHLVKKHTK